MLKYCKDVEDMMMNKLIKEKKQTLYVFMKLWLKYMFVKHCQLVQANDEIDGRRI